MDDRILELAAKKMGKGATTAELNELQELLNNDAGAEEILRIIADIKFISGPAHDTSPGGVNKRFIKIMKRIKYIECNPIQQTAVSNYKRHKPN